MTWAIRLMVNAWVASMPTSAKSADRGEFAGAPAVGSDRNAHRQQVERACGEKGHRLDRDADAQGDCQDQRHLQSLLEQGQPRLTARARRAPAKVAQAA